MNYYRICLLDQPKSSWVVHEIVKPLPKPAHKEGLPPVLHKFFPSADANVRMKPRYERLCCDQCGSYDTDAMYDAGFTEPVAIRFKQDFGYTHDRIFVMNDKCVRVLSEAKVGGYETQPIGTSGWNACRVTERVQCVDTAIRTFPPNCPKCGSPKDAGSSILFLSWISAPTSTKVLFATLPGCRALSMRDRDTFFTEEVLEILKRGKIKGPYCERLWTDEEARTQEEKEKQGVAWRPKGGTVYLSGK